MRSSILIVLILAASGAAARQMYVVVRTTDVHIRQFVCPVQNDVDEAVPVGVQVLRHGGMNWHAVGGVPPYTVIGSESGRVGTNCITVIDAAGNIATACGVIREFHEVVVVDCRTGQPSVFIDNDPPGKEDKNVRSPSSPRIDQWRAASTNWAREDRDRGTREPRPVVREQRARETHVRGTGGGDHRPVYNRNVDRGQGDRPGNGGAHGRSQNTNSLRAR